MSPWSALLGTADSAYASINWLFTPSKDRFFSHGYGDIDRIRNLQSACLREWEKDGMESWFLQLPALNFSWSAEDGAKACEQPEIYCSEQTSAPVQTSACRECTLETKASVPQIYDFTFTSPLVDYLPSEVGTGHGRLILPDCPVRGLVLHAAATNTETYSSRQEKLAIPLLQYGIASLLMTVPYYGVRRAKGQESSKLLTVADYQLQNLGVIFEGVALLRWLNATYPRVPLGVTGISWGGAMAACIGVTCRLPVACVPCLGITSPACMVTGIINWQINWEKLQAERSHSLEEAKSALEAEFRGITLKTLVDTSPCSSSAIASMVQVSARDDYYVFAWEGQVLYDTIAPACRKHGLRWVDGGHVSSFVSASSDFVKAIVDAFEGF